ncbi:MAG TPA: glycosyltransferase family 2 protein [Steroidobacteraceae bacterium]|nr:glycosyltransferase family 2 protein [Steroidobacteraceae bacterium]
MQTAELAITADSILAAAADKSVAVLIPCHNEAAAVGAVVRDFRRFLPTATIHVYDNASTDDTARLARQAGAFVRHEPLRGKGNVVRRMLSDVDADVYVLVDGDDTYDATMAPRLVEHLIEQGLDMVNCARVPVGQTAFRPGHALGNRLLSGIITFLFGNRVSDVLSGYRVMSRRFVKSFPALSSGFEIETELTVHGLELRVPIAELAAPYRERPAGSASKLNTVRDGVRILRLIFHLMKEERPLQFFGCAFVLLATASAGLGTPVVHTYLQTGLVPRLPTAVLATGLIILAFLALVCGLVLDTVTRGRREMKRLYYLQAGFSAPLPRPHH